MDQEKNEKELTPFQIRNIRLLTHLFAHNAVTDEIVDDLRLSELEHYELLEKCKLLETRANFDEKTSLLKYSKGYLTTIIKTASRIFQSMDTKKYPSVLVRFDIDDFSRFNTVWGHDVGDKVLIMVSNIIRSRSRPTDYVIRFGGEEIDVILPGISIQGAEIFISRIIEAIRLSRIEVNNEELGVTVSAGVSMMEYHFEHDQHISPEQIEEMYLEMQRHSDDALYEAKYLGKDRYCKYDPSKKDEYVIIRKEYDKNKKM
jgi:diguanylate cyclase (GGDEF)-like protein